MEIKIGKWNQIIWTPELKLIVREFIDSSMLDFSKDKKNYSQRIQWSKAWTGDNPAELAHKNINIKVGLSWTEPETKFHCGQLWTWRQTHSYFSIPIHEIESRLREKKLQKLLK